MRPIVLGISGRIGSGKSTLSALVAEELHFPLVSFGDCVRDIARYMGIDPSHRPAQQEIGEVYAQYPEPFCRKVLAQRNYRAGQSLVIDGIRHEEIVDELRRQVAPAELVLVYIDADETAIEDSLRGEGNTHDNVLRLVVHPTEAQVTTILPSLADIRIQRSAFHTPENTAQEIVERVNEYMMQGKIKIDENGVALIDDTNTKVIEVVLDATVQGRSIEEIYQQHRHLSRTQIRAALKYYDEHRQEIDAEIERRYQFAETRRQQATHQFTREELEERLRKKDERKLA